MREDEQQDRSPEEILKGKKILFVDDTATVRENKKEVFDLVNLKITTANDGQQALDLLAKQPDFDLVITDLQMPVMEGLELLKKIIKDPDITTCKTFILHTSIPLSVLSSRIDKLNKDAQDGNTGINIQYMNKGTRIRDFLSTVADAVK